jgi:hypothetical protein
MCFCCDRLIDVELSDNLTAISAAYGGVWFRAYGNFGSTVFYPIPKDNEFIQILICDECLKTRPGRITRVHNIKHQETGDVGAFNPHGEKE